MKNQFNKRSSGNRKDSRGGYSGGKSFGGNDSWKRGGGSNSRPSMHRAICGKCDESCEVPFKPNG
ncbi:MAG: hypothetical protein ABIA47_01295, partial [bacterium]